MSAVRWECCPLKNRIGTQWFTFDLEPSPLISIWSKGKHAGKFGITFSRQGQKQFIGGFESLADAKQHCERLLPARNR